MIRGLMLIAAVLCAAAQTASAEPPRETTIRATGIGRPPKHMTGPRAKLMARRAAEVVAVRNLAAKLQGQMVPTGRAGIARSRLDGVVRGFRYLPPRELPDGTITVTVELGPPETAHIPAGEQAVRLDGPTAEPPARRDQHAAQWHHQVQMQMADLRAQIDRARARLEAQAARLEATIAAVQQRVEALRQELTEVRAALADLGIDLRPEVKAKLKRKEE